MNKQYTFMFKCKCFFHSLWLVVPCFNVLAVITLESVLPGDRMAYAVESMAREVLQCRSN